MKGPSLDRARGALLGLAVGDALGTTTEFARIEQAPYPTLATGPSTDIVGDGPFGLSPGAITDDTQLAVCLARSLVERKGFDAANVAARYVAWQDEAFDIGNQTRMALWAIEKTGSTAGGMVAWRDSGLEAAGNGSLMRTTPIAVASSTLTAAIDASIGDSLLTHADPRCVLACVAHNAAIWSCIHADEPMTGKQMLDVAWDGVREGARRLTALWTVGVSAAGAGDETLESIDVEVTDVNEGELARIESARVDLLRDLTMAEKDNPDVYGEDVNLWERAGFVRLAFRIAFWHAVHTPSWRDALVDLASRGGDADTNCAIAGALLGARDGASAIPEAWVKRVLGATQPGSERWAEMHHPKHLLLLVEK